MKYSILLSFLFSSVSLSSFGDTEFTAVAASAKNAYIATTEMRPGHLPQAKIYSVDSHEFIVKNIKMSDEMLEREVIALFPLDSGLLVLTQHRLEDGDYPTLFKLDKDKWVMQGTLKCTVFNKINLNKDSLKVNCNSQNEKGVQKTTDVYLKLSSSVEKKIEYSLPMNKSANEKMQISLEGQDYMWTEATIKSGEKSKKIKISDLK